MPSTRIAIGISFWALNMNDLAFLSQVTYYWAIKRLNNVLQQNGTGVTESTHEDAT